MLSLARLDRQEQRERLAGAEFDVLVIGGGITGAGIALDAAARGLRVGLVDERDFASGTSSWSTKLVHGGIRYLPQLQISLVREALVERGRLMRLAPYLVEPLPFVLPLYRFNRHPLGLNRTPPLGLLTGLWVRSGLIAYDLLAGRLNIGRHRRLSSDELTRIAQWLRRDGLLEAYTYYDARTDDARLVINVLLTAVRYGAVICNYCRVTGFDRQGGRLVAALVRDTLDGHEFATRAKLFINATGVHGEALERLASESPAVHIVPSKGVHLVLERSTAGVQEAALVLPETTDRRLLFLVPYGSRAILGTTDTGMGPLDEPRATDEDIDYLLAHANRYLTRTLTRNDVVSVYAGYRPLIQRRRTTTTAKLSRSHVLVEHQNGLISILGGKLTTYRRMAEETTDRIVFRLGRPLSRPTRWLPLIGTPGLAAAHQRLAKLAREVGVENSLAALVQAHGAVAEAVLRLVAEDRRLGQPIVPELPYLLAQVVHACRYELAQTLTDVLERRMWVMFADWHHGLPALEVVSTVMARELGWDEERRMQEVGRYRQRVLSLFGAERGVAARLAVAAGPALAEGD